MWKMIFGTIVVLFVLGFVFFAGFIVGSTVTPLNVSAVALADAPLGVVAHG